MKGKFFLLCACFIASLLLFSLSSCGSKEDNDSGNGYSSGYNTAKAEYQKQIDELENRISVMETEHKKQLADSYDKGFREGKESVEKKILGMLDSQP